MVLKLRHLDIHLHIHTKIKKNMAQINNRMGMVIVKYLKPGIFENSTVAKYFAFTLSFRVCWLS